MGKTFEQAPVKNNSAQPGFLHVTIPRSGDEISDAGLISHYESMGYEYSAKSESGAVTMRVSKEVSDARERKAIEDHKQKETSRVLGSGDARDLNNVKDVVERANKPVSIEQLGAMMGASPSNVSSDYDDSDEL